MKNVLVTGGARGLGRAVTEYFAAKGVRVFSCDILDFDYEGENIVPLKIDVRDSESVRQVYETVSKETDRLDAVIHFAGIYRMDSYMEMEEEDFKKIMDINLFGVYRINRQFLPLLRDGGRVIIATSELAPLDPLPFNGIYSLSKTSLDCYAQSLRIELSLLDIPVIVIRPGAFATDMIGASDISMRALCEKTQLYKANSQKFKGIMDKVTVKALPPVRLAKLTWKAFSRKHPKYVYSKNASFLLKLYSAMPTRIQVWAIKTLIK